jgi:hypothetical protein
LDTKILCSKIIKKKYRVKEKEEEKEFLFRQGIYKKKEKIQLMKNKQP